MKRFSLLAAALVFCCCAAALAEAPLQVVQRLRAEGKPAEALAYLHKLRAKPPPGMSPADLALLTAETSLDVARLPNGTTAEREQRLAQARADCTSFLTAQPARPRRADIGLGLARVLHANAATRLIGISHLEDPSVRQAERQRTRPLFEAAEQLFAQLNAAAGSAQSATEFERARNLFDTGATFGDSPDETIKRGDMIVKAGAMFKALARASEGTALGWQARAWAARCQLEIDSPQDAIKEFAAILSDKSDASAGGRRLAEYFRLLALDRNPALYAAPGGDTQAEIVRAGERWLTEHAAEGKTLERDTVLYLIGSAFMRRAEKLAADPAFAGRARPFYVDAERRFRIVARGDSEYARPAREARDTVLATLARSHISRAASASQNSFDEQYLQAELELTAMAEEPHKPGAEERAARKGHFENVQASLTRALDTADESTSADDVTEARALLAWTYLQNGDAYRAAVLAEEVARHGPPTRMAATAAAYGLEAYSEIADDEERRGSVAAVVDADRARLHDLAVYMEQTWPSDPAADAARHQLGDEAYREHHYVQAIAVLSQIGPGYRGYTFSQYELANAALRAQESNLPAPRGTQGYRKIAVDALQKIPALANGTDPATAHVYMSAKMMLAKALFSAHRYRDMDELTDRLSHQLDHVNLDADTRQTVRSALEELAFYAVLARADETFRAGGYADARKALEPLVAQYRQKQLAVKDPELVRALLGLALRADVQLGDMAAARDLLGLLAASVSDLEKGGTSAILVGLVQQMQEQVEELRRQGVAKEAELQQTISRFASFLDELARQPGKAVTPELRHFLALAYSSLDKHDEAAKLLAQEPKPAAAKDPEKEAAYRATRVALARELRLARRFDGANAVLDDVSSSEAGRRSLEVRYERIHILEDQGQYVRAAREWDKVMKGLAPLMSAHPELAQKARKQQLGDSDLRLLARQNRYRDEYFDCYFHFVQCCVGHALATKDVQKRQERFERAAEYILRLEQNQPDLWRESQQQRYQQLLEQQPLLKQQYSQAKGGGMGGAEP